MAERQLSGWHIVTLITAALAIIAISAVALILGKDALIAMAVVLGGAVILMAWFLYG